MESFDLKLGMHGLEIETKAVQGGYSPKNSEPRILPIYQSILISMTVQNMLQSYLI